MKFVLIGEEEVGKTSLLKAYCTGCFSKEYVPTIFDHFETNVSVCNERHMLSLTDTSGKSEYERFRVLSFPKTDTFLLCFSVVTPESFEKVKSKFAPEIKQHCPTARIVVVGTQVDLRDDVDTVEKLAKDGLRPVAKTDGEQLARELGAFKYVECSALTMLGVKQVFHAAIISVFEREYEGCNVEKTTKCRCTIS
ncbi:unnamed protein product [Caenorhabditis auriculariae]|uniref:Uncharacterized protein n=1 Tax=Caenorhabditis auriculariae TaxID=2777116 RepID=A0A8S1HCA8_9PELO|nr:unnamed protein product [Caenorhabditis auriculariae]